MSISTLERELNLDEEVLRHMLVSVQGEFMRVPQLLPESALFPERPTRENGRFRRDSRDDREGPERSRPQEAAGPATESETAVEESEPSESASGNEVEESNGDS